MTYAEIVRFHGHRCPGLAMGYRMAAAGLEALKSVRAGRPCASPASSSTGVPNRCRETVLRLSWHQRQTHPSFLCGAKPPAIPRTMQLLNVPRYIRCRI